jgi:hypothetical protein
MLTAKPIPKQINRFNNLQTIVAFHAAAPVVTNALLFLVNFRRIKIFVKL